VEGQLGFGRFADGEVRSPTTPAQQPSAKPGRLQEIDVAKGIGILLVVIGHLVAVRSQGPVGYAMLKTWIYQYHMPFFMCLSGFTFERYVRKYRDQPFRSFALARADRLLIPFVVFGTLIAGMKLLAANFVAVDDSATSVSQTVYEIFIDTRNSPVLSIWYVWVLFVYSIVMFPVLKAGPRAIAMGAAVSVAAYVLTFTDALYIDRIATYSIFFISGIYLSMAYAKFTEVQRPIALVLLGGGFAAASAVAVHYNVNNKPLMLLVSVFAIPFLWYTALSATRPIKQFLLLLGRNSMAIYLINTLVIGVVKIAYGKLFHGAGFLGFALAATFAAILVPIVISHYLRLYAPNFGKYLA